VSIREKTCIALLLAVLAPVASGAQALSFSGPAVEMSALVPPILLVSIDEHLDTSMVIVGLVDPSSRDFVQSSDRRFFELRSDRTCVLGSFNLFSNIPEKYKVTIVSQNGALLLPSSGDKDDGIPYRLRVGGNCVAYADGAFVYIGSGKSPRGGSPLSLELQAGPLPRERRSDRYFDALTFAVSVE
jgi:hypothetical protein